MGALLTRSPASIVGSASTSKRSSGVGGGGGGGSSGENEIEEGSPLAARGKMSDQVWEVGRPLPEFRTNVRQVSLPCVPDKVAESTRSTSNIFDLIAEST